MKKRAEWKMPDWMERYRDCFTNTGGNSIDNLMNDTEANMFNNSIRASLCIACISQVGLLHNLREKGELK